LKGTVAVPFFFVSMLPIESQIEKIQQLVNEMLQAEADYFCISIRIKPTSNIKVLLMAITA